VVTQNLWGGGVRTKLNPVQASGNGKKIALLRATLDVLSGMSGGNWNYELG
jgi:hypothetical protein